MSSKRITEILPVASLLFAATMWGIFWYPLRLLEAEGVAGLWAALLIYVATLVFGLPWLVKGRKEFQAYPKLLIGLGVANAWCNVTFFLAVLDGNIVRVLLLFYLSPIWAVILGKWILKEHISRFAVLNLVLAMTGALAMLWEPGQDWPWPHSESDWLAISSGFAFALGNVMTRKAENVSITSKTASAWISAVILATAWLVYADIPFPDVSGTVILSAMALGFFGIVAMTSAVLYGVTHMPVHRSSVILLFELIAGAVSAQLLTDEVVAQREWLGGALILLAAWLTTRRQLH